MSRELTIKSKKFESIVFLLTLLAFQVLMVVLFAVWVRYDSNANHASSTGSVDSAATGGGWIQASIDSTYGYFRDVNIMIFFGFGFLMTFLRRYGYSALGYTFLISAMVAQWSILVMGFFETVHESVSDYHFEFNFNIVTMLNGLFCAGAVMISYGAILGRITPTQMLIMGILEPIFYFLNMFIGDMNLKAIDVGGGMYIHTFGCYFGLTVCWFLTTRAGKESPDTAPSYNGDLFSMAGTLFLWMMWPSFNAAIAPAGDAQFRALANTFISLTSSTMATFIVSRLLGHMGHKLDMVHVQNSTLAGGVVMGVLAHLNISPAIAIVMGFVAGSISVLGYVYLTPFMCKRLNIQDTCGINNLHGMPGFIGSIAAVIAAARGVSNTYLYGDDYDIIFRAGDDQAKNNAAATFITVGIAIGGGLVTGIILKLVGKLGKLQPEEYYNDNAFWNVAHDYPADIKQQSTIVDEEVGGASIEMDLHKKVDLNDIKKKGSSRAYRREIIRLLETLVLSEGLSRKYDSDSESGSDSDSDSSSDEGHHHKKRHHRRHHHHHHRHSKKDKENNTSTNNNNTQSENSEVKKDQEIHIPDTTK